jgi:hypothetical protein
VDPVPPRRVVRRRDDPPAPRVSADDERLVPKLGTLQFLDRGEEGVEIQVRDDRGTNGHA